MDENNGFEVEQGSRKNCTMKEGNSSGPCDNEGDAVFVESFDKGYIAHKATKRAQSRGTQRFCRMSDEEAKAVINECLLAAQGG